MKGIDSLMNFAKFLGMDYVIHQKGTSVYMNDFSVDAIYSVSTNTFGIWMLGNPNSRYFIRQFAASAYHFTRILTTCGMTAVDYTFSSLVRAFNPKQEGFSSLAVNQRTYKRFMLALRLNGGVYDEFGNILRNSISSVSIFPSFRQFSELNNEYPVKRNQASPSTPLFSLFSNSSKPRIYNINEIKKLFRSQTGKDFDSVFSDVSFNPSESGTVIVHDAVLRTGEKVSISIIPPFIQRMRTLDLLPFHAFRAILSIVPFTKTEKAVFDAVLSRLTYSLPREVRARQMILEKAGVDIKLKPALLFRQTRRQLTGFIGAPIDKLCTRNIMVSDRLPRQFSINIATARRISDSFSEILFKHGILIPDLSLENIRGYSGNATFARFGSAVPVPGVLINRTIRLFSSIRRGDKESSISLGKDLKISRQAIERSLRLGSIDAPLVKALLAGNAQSALAVAEAAGGLTNLRRATRRSALLVPVGLGLAAKRSSPGLDHTSMPYSLGLWAKYLPF